MDENKELAAKCYNRFHILLLCWSKLIFRGCYIYGMYNSIVISHIGQIDASTSATSSVASMFSVRWLPSHLSCFLVDKSEENGRKNARA